MSTSKKYIGSMIKHQRKKKNLTQEKLGDLIGADRQYVWRLENGKINVTPDYLDVVIEKIGCSQDDFAVVGVLASALRCVTNNFAVVGVLASALRCVTNNFFSYPHFGTHLSPHDNHATIVRFDKLSVTTIEVLPLKEIVRLCR